VADLNPVPVDYKVWAVMQEKITRQRLQILMNSVIASLMRGIHVIDAAVRQWRARLRACVSARGGHF